MKNVPTAVLFLVPPDFFSFFPHPNVFDTLLPSNSTQTNIFNELVISFFCISVYFIVNKIWVYDKCKITPFCFYLNFIQPPNCFGFEVVNPPKEPVYSFYSKHICVCFCEYERQMKAVTLIINTNSVFRHLFLFLHILFSHWFLLLCIFRSFRNSYF